MSPPVFGFDSAPTFIGVVVVVVVANSLFRMFWVVEPVRLSTIICGLRLLEASSEAKSSFDFLASDDVVTPLSAVNLRTNGRTLVSSTCVPVFERAMPETPPSSPFPPLPTTPMPPPLLPPPWSRSSSSSGTGETATAAAATAAVALGIK